ncbi:MAG: glycogen synthase [Armatimonadota bacterium]
MGSLKILFVSVEVAPLAKVGGLADVAGSLPKALRAMGHDVRILMPSYSMNEKDPKISPKTIQNRIPVDISNKWKTHAHVSVTQLVDGTPVYMLGHYKYFTDASDSTKVYTSDPLAYLFFDRAALELPDVLGWTPDIIHINDWHTGLLPHYLDQLRDSRPRLKNVATAYTIHNLAYQGQFNWEIFQTSGLPNNLWGIDGVECYGQLNFLKAGLTGSDAVNTVSMTYSREILTPEYGCGLDGVLRNLQRDERLFGILNGIDDTVYDPANDPETMAHFNIDDTSGKAACKAALQKECGLEINPDVPMIGMISRLAEQKGLDLIEQTIEPVMNETGAQFVALGIGDEHFRDYLLTLERRRPGQMKALIRFDEPLAHRIYSSSDIFLMPSRFEPCGLGQLMALRYGTIPVVRTTGGLADTIIDYSPSTRIGNGFTFNDPTAEELQKTLLRAVHTYQNEPEVWKYLVHTALNSDFGWHRPASKYEQLYHRALEVQKGKIR